MKVKVNQDACIGCGACPSIAPEIFELNDEGLSFAKVEEVKEELTESAQDAIDTCPTGAIEEVKEELTESAQDAIDACPTGAIEEVKEELTESAQDAIDDCPTGAIE